LVVEVDSGGNSTQQATCKAGTFGAVATVCKSKA